jgi:hypothetical protein
MARSKFRRSLRFENLEGRQLLSSGGPTDQQQYMLQLINEARTNPPAAAAMIGSDTTPDVQATLNYYGVNLQSALQTISSATPQPPVAWNADLAASAQAQSQYMANYNIQSHTGANGSTSEQRMQQAGYSNIVSNAENAYAYAGTPFQAMQAFLIDWGVPSDGHRINIQQPGVSAQNASRDVGIGIVQTNPSSPSSVGPLIVTQDFGSQANEQAQVVGVAYHDNSGSKFYQPGEGQGGLQIDAVNLQTGQVSSTQTWDSGGYELSLSPGQYRIIASLNDQVFQTTNVSIGTVNVEQDFVLSDPWQGGTRESAIAAAQPQLAQPQPTPPPVAVQPVVTVPVTYEPAISQAVTPQPGPSQPSAGAQPSLMSLLAPSWTVWNAPLS